MFVLRCTKKLLARLGPPRTDLVTSTTRLGDWTANLLFFGRQQLVLAVNDRTLLPVLLPIAPNKTFLSRFSEAAGEMLMALGIDRQQVRTKGNQRPAAAKRNLTKAQKVAAKYESPAGAAAAGPPPTTGSNGPSAVTTASAPTTTSAPAPVAAPPAPTNDVAHS